MVFRNPVFAAVAVLIGAVVGAGFLGIPYVVAKSGFIVGLFHIILLGAVMMFVNLALGEVTLRTEGNHQLTGYAEKYLGRLGKNLFLFELIFGVFSALLAYTIGVGDSISHLLVGDSSLLLMTGLFVWAVMTFITFFGVKTFKQGETIGLILMVLFVVAITIMLASDIRIENLSTFHPAFIFAPFGAVLFAFISYTAIPELERILEYNKDKMKKAIIIGSVTPMIIYAVFTFVVVGVKGNLVPEVASISLGSIFIFLGIVTMLTSYLALAIILKSMLHFDYKVPEKMAWFIISLISLNLFLLALRMKFSFTTILGYAGIVSGALAGILILLMIRKAKKLGDRKPEYQIPINWFIIILLALIFILGGILSFIRF